MRPAAERATTALAPAANTAERTATHPLSTPDPGPAPGGIGSPTPAGPSRDAAPPPVAEAGPTPAAAGRAPIQPLLHLDALWIQVAGTLCNLRCTHCFVSCGPGDDRHGLMSRGEVRARVAEGLALGVREIYFTGGEPFVHPQMTPILEDTLAVAPATVLTNGTLLPARRLAALRALADAARHSLEIRVSLDGLDAGEHDRVRGAGSFARALEGIRGLERHGLLPIVTITQWERGDPDAFRARAVAMLREHGVARPRLKLLPLFGLGRHAVRERGGRPTSLAALPPGSFDPGRLQCGTCRAVTSRGVFVCPLLVDEPGARMGDTLEAARGGFEVSHSACVTCWTTGMTCANG